MSSTNPARRRRRLELSRGKKVLAMQAWLAARSARGGKALVPPPMSGKEYARAFRSGFRTPAKPKRDPPAE